MADTDRDDTVNQAVGGLENTRIFLGVRGQDGAELGMDGQVVFTSFMHPRQVEDALGQHAEQGRVRSRGCTVELGTAASLGVRRQSLADAGAYRWLGGISGHSLNQAYRCRPRSEPGAGDWPLVATSAFVGIYSFADLPGNWQSLR